MWMVFVMAVLGCDEVSCRMFELSMKVIFVTCTVITALGTKYSMYM